MEEREKTSFLSEENISPAARALRAAIEALELPPNTQVKYSSNRKGQLHVSIKRKYDEPLSKVSKALVAWRFPPPGFHLTSQLRPLANVLRKMKVGTEADEGSLSLSWQYDSDGYQLSVRDTLHATNPDFAKNLKQTYNEELVKIRKGGLYVSEPQQLMELGAVVGIFLPTFIVLAVILTPIIPPIGILFGVAAIASVVMGVMGLYDSIEIRKKDGGESSAVNTEKDEPSKTEEENLLGTEPKQEQKIDLGQRDLLHKQKDKTQEIRTEKNKTDVREEERKELK